MACLQATAGRRSGRPSSTTRAGFATPSRIRAFIAEFGPVESHETLKRVPPGYPPDHPMADLFRYKDIVFGRRLSDDEVYSPELPDILATAYGRATPVFRFLSSLDG